jgi:hypothetical protein
MTAAEFARFALVAEGFESAVLACSLILLGPGVAVGLTARAAAVPAMAAYSVGVLSLAWLRYSDRGGDHPPLLLAAALVIGTILLLVPLIHRLDLAAIPAGLLIGAVAAELWQPCNSPELAILLGQLPDRGASGLGWLAVYLAGTLAPLAVLAAIHHLTPDTLLERLEPIWSVAGGTVLALPS